MTNLFSFRYPNQGCIEQELHTASYKETGKLNLHDILTYDSSQNNQNESR